MKELLAHNYYVFKRYGFNRTHEKSRFKVEIYPSIIVEFGEPKSKLKSKKYKMIQINFLKERYSREIVDRFLKRFHVKYIKYKHNGRKLPPIYRVMGRADKLIREGNIIICDNTSSHREAFARQNEYDFWRNEFYEKNNLSNDYETLNYAIPLLIDKIDNNTDFLNQIPNSDSRIFEELVADIFREYGYEVELTKKTRDGGRDIIALKRKNGKVNEKILIECKHWNDAIGISSIRELIGVAIAEDEFPTGIILATTSRFSKDAKAYMPKAVKIDLDRKDFDDIIEWIGDYGAIQFSKSGINNYFKSLINWP
ncbi:MAG: restriction endonuclease [Lachnospiraceae bacterium]|nr:restriction endonuclease [Lachnospiraceae bacterium]